MAEFIRQLQMVSAGGEGASELQFVQAAMLLLHAILNGLMLMFLTWRMYQFKGAAPSGKKKSAAKSSTSSFVMNSANVLFLCAGMAAVMILVNDNIARAFAIGAAVALVRFRIKLSEKFLAAALFYAVLVGMACGVSRVDIAWAVTLVFGLIVEIVGLIGRVAARKERGGRFELVAPVAGVAAPMSDVETVGLVTALESGAAAGGAGMNKLS